MPNPAAGRWFYAQGDKRLGPVELAELAEMIVTGQLEATALVWRQGLAAWTAAERIPEIAEHLPPPLPVGGAAAAAPPPAPAAAVAAPPPAAPPRPLAVADTPRIAELRERLEDEANWRAFPQLADELRKAERYDEALAVCRAGLAKHPDYRLARTTLAQILISKGDFETAKQGLLTVLASAPENLSAGRLLAECLERMGDKDGALQTIKSTLTFAPRDPQLLARLQELSGEPEPPADSEAPPEDAEGAEGEPGAAAVPPELEEATERAAAGDYEDERPIPLVPADEEFELERPGDHVQVVRTAATLTQTPFTSQDPSYWATRSLAENDFPDLIQALHERHWTGTMALTQVGAVKTVVVNEGRLVFASSSSPDDRLGELLLRRGRITVAQFLEASKAVGQGKRLGAALVDLGALEPGDLVKVVVEHTQEVIYSVFQWTDGFYRLKDGLDGNEAITLKMSTPDIVLEGIRRIESWSRIERGIGGIDTRYERSEDWEQQLKHMTLPTEKLGLLSEHTDVRSVREICQQNTMLSDFEVCRTVWAFRVIGALRPAPPVSEAESEP